MATKDQQDKQAVTPDTTADSGNDLSAFVSRLLDQGEALKQEKDALTTRTRANRDMLRNLVATGAATDDQKARVVALYPRTEKKDKSTDNAGDQPAAA